MSWVGPAVVVAVERLDGAIKRVWIRYRHKLRGLPLEHIRLATGDEIEATQVTKEALQQLADQLKKGRVNAELIPTHEEAANRGEEQARAALPAQAPAPDPRYPAMTLSDDEQQPSDDDIGPEELKKATSVLDDLPMSVAAKIRKKGDPGEGSRSTRRRLSPTSWRSHRSGRRSHLHQRWTRLCRPSDRRGTSTRLHSARRRSTSKR